MQTEIKDSIIQVIGAIPAGKVCTYGKVAQRAGLPNHARYVGTLLKKLPAGSTIPWHRVINGKGEISFPIGSDKWLMQKNKLEMEGVTVNNGKVRLSEFLWN